MSKLGLNVGDYVIIKYEVTQTHNSNGFLMETPEKEIKHEVGTVIDIRTSVKNGGTVVIDRVSIVTDSILKIKVLL